MSECMRTANQHRCLPLSAIIPPASLTAGFSHSERSTMENVPSVRWDQVYVELPRSRFIFEDASQISHRIASAVIYGGRILPMTPNHQNYSYVHSFSGPRLRCKDDEDEGTFSNHVQLDHSNSDDEAYYNATRSPMILWISTQSRNITCRTWNVTYTTSFSFTNDVQDAQVSDVRYDHVVSRDKPNGTSVDSSPYSRGYQGWFESLASILAGNIVYRSESEDIDPQATRILQTSLAGCPELQNASKIAQTFNVHCPGQDLAQAIEALSANVTLSYLASIPDV